jgi:hypothetical protein|tara:strand:+ start:267 stop:626 length:360 start_codon:yes stop_codon:yes gene_type:complete
LSSHLDPRFKAAVDLFNRRAWYEAHDAFEEIWHETAGSDRRLLQGILQIAVAHVHLERGNLRGATILLGEGVGRLSSAESGDLGLDLPSLRDQARLRLEALQRETDPVALPFPELHDHS